MCRVTRELPQPIQLPQAIQNPRTIGPVMNPSTAHNVMVKTAPTRIEPKQALVSRSSNVYEMGPVLREGKFGQIRVASILKNTTKENEFERSSDKPVALKIYSTDKIKHLRDNATENPWLEIEIQQMIGNKHPNLIGILETCIIDQTLFIVLPFFSGGDLLDVIENRYMGPLPVSQAKKMFSHLVNGLKTLHDYGIVHRDISIENILYDDATDTFALCDFGLAVRVPRDPATGAFEPFVQPPTCGKEGYIAPELWKTHQNDDNIFIDLFACDVWSCGIVLFMALTGSAPLQRATEFDPYYQMISEKRLMEMLGELDVDLETYGGLELVQTILDPDPINRPRSVDLLTNSWIKS